MNHAALRVIGLISFSLLLAGCASTPETRYYTLDTGADREVRQEKTLGVRPVRVPDYLDDNRIWVRPEAHRVEALPHVRWAEPMPRAITRALQMHFGAVPETDRSPQLLVDIQRFEALWGETDRVVLVAHWHLEQHSGIACRVSLEESLSERDAATLVAAKVALVTELASRIEAQLADAEQGC